ncbi:hypothetical protein ACFCX4_12865 [Kitasatospora sp. NPDC056327]|uniref:hypothetical protein n=1 Tax=Kitasatospora sp. NPDC056327 TaxID=3345785 RepID=UPI0035DFD479
MPAIDDHDDHDHRPGRADPPGPAEPAGPAHPAEPAPPEEPSDLGPGLLDFDAFLRASAGLTGFDEAELRATGVAHEHHRTLLAHRVRDEHALLHLWYVGSWPDEPPSSARAHDRGLMWRTFHGAAPGSTAPGHGSWAGAPYGGGGR